MRDFATVKDQLATALNKFVDITIVPDEREPALFAVLADKLMKVAPGRVLQAMLNPRTPLAAHESREQERSLPRTLTLAVRSAIPFLKADEIGNIADVAAGIIIELATVDAELEAEPVKAGDTVFSAAGEPIGVAVPADAATETTEIVLEVATETAPAKVE